MIAWIRDAIYAVKNYERDIGILHSKIHALSLDHQKLANILKEHTNVAVDIAPYSKGHSYCILIGNYKGHDYVRCWELQRGDFIHLVEQLRSMYKYHNISHVDVMPEFRAFINRSLEE